MSVSHFNSNAAATSLPVLQAAVHWRVESPFAQDAANLSAQAEMAGLLAGTQMAYTSQHAGFDAEQLVVCSTILSTAVTMDGEPLERFYGALEKSGGLQPQGILNAYLCTGWGYALRYFMKHTDVKRLAIVTIDVDLHNLAWNLRHPVIGPSGFGVTTLLFTLPDDCQNVPRCSGPHPNSAFNEFIVALKSYQKECGVRPVFIPFTLGSLAGTAERVLAKGTLGPNRNAEYGHCFGSDPWIGIIEWLGSTPLDAPRTVTAGAIAYNGYYTLAGIEIEENAVIGFKRIDGHLAALEQTIAEHQCGAAAPNRAQTLQQMHTPPSTGEASQC